jgi:ABC-type proline/glycine betaine transport system substrate-binding protein
MEKEYFIIYLSVDGKHYNNVTITSKSFSAACKEAASFVKKFGLNLVTVSEKQAFKDNFQIFNC